MAFGVELGGALSSAAAVGGRLRRNVRQIFPNHYFRPSSKDFLSLRARVDASFVALPAILAVLSSAVGACCCAARTPRISVRHIQRQTANTIYRKTTEITPFTAALAMLHSASDMRNLLCITEIRTATTPHFLRTSSMITPARAPPAPKTTNRGTPIAPPSAAMPAP